ncbi:MAG: hypothetical protein WA261_13485 [Candidatus Sulfotelmatobacter sp.]|jgi:hypothetical protein
MGGRLKITGFMLAVVLCLPIAGRADTQTTPAPHRAHSKNKKKTVPPPLPSGTQGPVPQIPLDAIPAVAPEVSYENGLLTINAPNSTLGDILRSVRKHTSADIEIPASANERVVTRLGPAPAREVMAELLNGSRFNYILLGSPEDANALVRVVLVAKTPDTPAGQPGQTVNGAPPPAATNPTADAQAEAAEENIDESADQSAADAEQPAANPDQPGVKTPQQLLQEMQQRQMLMQQQQANQPGAPPVMPAPHQPQPQQDQ